MAARRTRLTPRGVVVLTAFSLAGVLAVALVVVRSQQPDCTVRVGDREVGLDRDQAERVSKAVAGVVRRDGTLATARNAVLGELVLAGGDAEAVASALTGRSRGAFSCDHGGADEAEDDALDATGLTARSAAVRDDVAASFGDLPLGGFAPGGVTTGHMPGSAHYDGRAIDIFFRPISAAAKQQGWAVAQYLVAQAERLSITTVIFDDQIWTSRRAGSGWREYDVDTDGRSAATAKILEHRDHVHVDVAD